MPTWEVVDHNRKLIKAFESEVEANEWANHENELAAARLGLRSLGESFETEFIRLRVAIMGF